MKRTALALTFILMLLFSAVPVLQFVSLVSANAIPYPSTPNQDSPTLAVQTPQDGETFMVSTIEVKFTVTKPNSWLLQNRTLYNWAGFPIVGTFHVHLYLDDELLNPLSIHDPHSENLTTSHSMVLKDLTRGGHSVKIDLVATTFYENPNPGPHELDYFSYQLDNVSDTIYFTINTDTFLPSPEPQQTETFPTALVVAPIGSLAVASACLLVYFRKRKR